MTVGDGAALFGRDGTGDDVVHGLGPDAVGPLPRLELPVLRLPVIGPDGQPSGLAAFDDDLARPVEPVDPVPTGVIGGSERGVVSGPVEGSQGVITGGGVVGRGVVIGGSERGVVSGPVEGSQGVITGGGVVGRGVVIGGSERGVVSGPVEGSQGVITGGGVVGRGVVIGGSEPGAVSGPVEGSQQLITGGGVVGRGVVIGGSEPGAVSSPAERSQQLITGGGVVGRGVVIGGSEPGAVSSPAERSQQLITEAAPRSTTGRTARVGARSRMGRRHNQARSDPEPWPTAAQRSAARDARHGIIAAPGTPEIAPRTAVPFIAAPAAPLPARPRIEDDPGLLGITRRSHSRLGSRLFTLFFVFVFIVIAAQLVVALLGG